MTRLALGTVQFGLEYGVANLSGQVDPAGIAAILREARASGFDTLDTAIGYGDSESRLGAAGIAGWRVITKLPPLPADCVGVRDWVERQTRASLERLGIQQLDGLLLHRPADLLGPAGPDYIAALLALRERGVTRALGFSIYQPAELDLLWPLLRPDLIQAPCNVLDRRLVHSGWLQRLTDSGARVHIRSAFLQGLLLMEPERRPVALRRWRPVLDSWDAWCVSHGCTPLQGALAYVLRLSGVERVVVGVDSVLHLQQIVTASRAPVPPPPPGLFSDERDLIEPSRWNLT